MKTGAVLRAGCEEEDLGKHMERQMGCMTGFFQIFDRHQILAGRRGIYAAKRLASFPSPVASCSSASERSESSISSSSKDLPGMILFQAKPHLAEMRPPSPESAAWPEIPPRPSLPLPVFDVKEGRSSWKFKEAPRLSLDSRVDARSKLNPPRATYPNGSGVSGNAENLRRSPSVVARLMGLDALPCNSGAREPVADANPGMKTELRRSASESRASRDAVQYRFVDGGYLPVPSPQSHLVFEDKLREVRRCIVREGKSELRGVSPSPRRQPSPPPSNGYSVLQRKSFFDAQEYFLTEPPKRAVAGSSGEVEKRLGMRGTAEPVESLDSLKQILEVHQLKGLLRSRQQQLQHQQLCQRFGYGHPESSNPYESPIVVIKSAAPRYPSPRPPPPPRLFSPLNEGSPSPSCRGTQSLPAEATSRSPRRNRAQTDRAPARNINEARTRRAGTPDSAGQWSPASPSRRRPPEQASEMTATVRRPLSADCNTAAAHSPRSGIPRKNIVGATPAATRTKARIPCRSEDEFMTSDGCLDSFRFDSERVKAEQTDGRILLERCDKLLHSIAEITSKPVVDYDAEQVSGGEQQPSPVSVLDAGVSFDSDTAGASPSLPKRRIDFQAERAVECLPVVTSGEGSEIEDDDGDDFAFIAEILRRPSDTHLASHRKSLPLHRKLLFDAVAEIVQRSRQDPPWETFRSSRRSPAASSEKAPRPAEVWTELQRLQDHAPADDLCELICGVLRKDLEKPAGADRAWAERPAEMSDAVLDIERLIYKDLCADAIRELADCQERRRRQLPSAALPRRRLLF